MVFETSDDSATELRSGAVSPWVSVDSFGAVGDGVVDDSSAVQAALNSAAPVYLSPNKIYRITSTVVIPDDQALELAPGSILLLDTSSAGSAAIELSDRSVLTGAGTVTSHRSSWDSSAPLVGIRLVGSESIVEVGEVSGFEIGVFLRADGSGVAYSKVGVRSIVNCLEGIKLDAFNGGWVNQNYIDVQRLATWSGRVSDPNWLDSYGVHIDSHTPHSPNANRFSGSIEGVHAGVRLSGMYNRLDGLRLELPSSPGNPVLVEIEPTSHGDHPAWNWWFGEYGILNWSTDVAGSDAMISSGVPNYRALQAFGMRGSVLYSEEGLMFGAAYRAPRLHYDLNDDLIRLSRGTFDLLTANVASVNIQRPMKLVPRSSAPTSPDAGTMYYDASGALCVYVGSAWEIVAGTGTCS